MTSSNMPRASINEFLREIADGRQLSAHTVAAYTRDLSELADFLDTYFQCEDWTWDRVDRNALRRFLGKLAQQQLSRRRSRNEGWRSRCPATTPPRCLPAPRIKLQKEAAEVPATWPSSTCTTPRGCVSASCTAATWRTSTCSGNTGRSKGRGGRSES